MRVDQVRQDSVRKEEILEHNPREFNILNLAGNEDSGHFNCPTSILPYWKWSEHVYRDHSICPASS